MRRNEKHNTYKPQEREQKPMQKEPRKVQQGVDEENILHEAHGEALRKKRNKHARKKGKKACRSEQKKKKAIEEA